MNLTKYRGFTALGMQHLIARERELGETYDVPWRNAARGWRHGFSVRDVALIPAVLDRPGEFLSSAQQYWLLPSDRSATQRVENKELFVSLTPDRLLPPTYTSSDVEELPIGFEGIVKPVDGTAGRGVRSIEHGRNEWIVGGDRMTKEELGMLLEDHEHVLQERVRQHEYAKEINPFAVNTLRVVTINPSDRDPFVASVVHRFGTETEAPTDNWLPDGYVAPVDRSSGELGRLFLVANDGSGCRSSSVHRESGVEVEGRRVPCWDAVVDTALEVAEVHAPLRYIGWDIVLREDGTPIVLEGNARPHLVMQQIDGRGLLEDERVREFVAGLYPSYWQWVTISQSWEQDQDGVS